MKRVLDIFEEIARVPRPSKKEGRIRDWVLEFARKARLASTTDDAGNVVLFVEASTSCPDAPTIVLQGHLDMVCEKKPSSHHDFDRDPLRLRMDGDWLKATDTTLGADNGIAVAMALAYATDPEVAHPSLELLFTVDEETGLTGATKLSTDLLKGRVLLNLDSEEEGSFTVGCAGGRSSVVRLPVTRAPLTTEEVSWRLSLEGLVGGHSGVDIQEQRGNANYLLGRALWNLARQGSVRLVTFAGGNAHNAIPRDAEAVVVVDKPLDAKLPDDVARLNDVFRTELSQTDPDVRLVASKMVEVPEDALDRATSHAVAGMLVALPNGVHRYSQLIPGLVETSANLATVSIKNGGAEILVSQRSSSTVHLDALTEKIQAIAHAHGAGHKTENDYASWEPDFDAAIVERATVSYRTLFGKEPTVDVIHAGLEAGVIGAKYPGMEMISFGPTIEYAHSPDERLYVPSVEPTYRLMAQIVSSYCE